MIPTQLYVKIPLLNSKFKFYKSLIQRPYYRSRQNKASLVLNLSSIPSVHHRIVVALLPLVAIVPFATAIVDVNVAKQQQQQVPPIFIQIVSAGRELSSDLTN